MPKMLCKCEALLDDDDPSTTETLLAFTSEDWERREAEVDWRKQLPYTYSIWACRTCGRWYLFELDSDTPLLILQPDDDKPSE